MPTISCPHCSSVMKADDRFAGKKAKCGKCGNSFAIPANFSNPVLTEKEVLGTPELVRADRAAVADGEWHYARDGQRLGPISILKLKELAVSGTLGPGDLVWKPGMPDWVPAGQVRGLIERNSPPPLPPATGSSVGGNHSQAIAPGHQVTAAPALWNPGAAGLWSLFLPWGRGAFLVRADWGALGETRQAQRAMKWFYAALAFMALMPIIAVLQGPTAWAGLFYLIGNPVALLIWNWAECERQRKLLRQLFNNHYPRRGLLLPIVITILFSFAWLMFSGAVVATITGGK